MFMRLKCEFLRERKEGLKAVFASNECLVSNDPFNVYLRIWGVVSIFRSFVLIFAMLCIRSFCLSIFTYWSGICL